MLVLAAVMRDDFAQTLIYLFVGVFALGSWRISQAMTPLDYDRRAALLGIPVVHIANERELDIWRK